MTECHEACDGSGFIPTMEFDRREPNENWLRGEGGTTRKTQFSQTALPSTVIVIVFVIVRSYR